MQLYIYIFISIYWLGGETQLPNFLASRGPFCVSFPYICGLRGAIKSDSSQFSTGSCWIEPRRHPYYDQRAHAVLSREGGSTSLGPGVLFRETATRSGGRPGGSAPMLTGAPSRVKG